MNTFLKVIAAACVAAFVVLLVSAFRVAINAGIVAIICYWLCPIVGVIAEPTFQETFVYGGMLLLIGIALNTTSSVSKG
jgi:hypothetical protein